MCNVAHVIMPHVCVKSVVDASRVLRSIRTRMSVSTWAIVLLGYSQIIPIMFVLPSTSTASRTPLLYQICFLQWKFRSTQNDVTIISFAPMHSLNSYQTQLENVQSFTVSKVMSRIMSC